ncbi:MAG: hypothetical protein WCG03_03380 [Kiritimatiellales bacterium]
MENEPELEQRIVPKKQRGPWVFVPCLGFTDGIFNGFASQYVNLVFKTMGASNTIVGLANLLQLPMGFKALWAPAVERWGTARSVLLTNMLVIAFLIGCMAGIFMLPLNTTVAIAGMFFLTIVVISFFEIASGAYRVSALTGGQLALFAGISSAAFRLGALFGNSFLIILVGKIHERMQSYHIAWAAVFGLVALIVVAVTFYLKTILPRPVCDFKNESKLTVKNYLMSFAGFFTQPGGIVISVYLFLCRFGEGMLCVIKNPFFMDPADKGGMGMSLTDVGIMGPFVIIAMTLAGIAGGIIVKVVGLKKSFFALGILMFVPHACFSWLALYPKYGMIKLFGMNINPWVLGATVIEVIGYAMAFAAIVTFSSLLSKNAGANKATFGAVAGSFNLLGFMLGGAASGIVQEQVGYFWTFNITILLAIPAWILILFLPLRQIIEKSAQLDAESK